MVPLKVFISSVMRRSLEDLSAEREVSRAAIESYSPIACAWAFENEPASTKRLQDSYLDEVRACDLMVLIVGRCMTPAVHDEFNTARDHNKGVLAFAKDTPEREAEAVEVLALLDAKYDSFTHSDDLQPKVRRAIGMEILRRAKPDANGGIAEADRIARLRKIMRAGRAIRITPLVPRVAHDFFRVSNITRESLELKKCSSDEHVNIPLNRVSEIVDDGLNQAPRVQIDGRLQWLTFHREWRFFLDRPEGNDPFHLGVPKEIARDDSLLVTMTERGYSPGWSIRSSLANRIAAGTHQVVYDDDGYYLQSSGAVLTTRT